MTVGTYASGPLNGIVVIDLTRVLAGPYCTMLLADLGARVIKVEMPERGDDSRRSGPFIGPPKSRRSAYFLSVNRNKESIGLDLKSRSDRATFERLVAKADIVVENFTSGTLDRLGYGWDWLGTKSARLMFASISGFRQTGPYSGLPANDMVAQAMGAIMSVTGAEGGPTSVGVPIGDIAAGVFAVTGVLTALFDRTTSGKGKHVDVTMCDSQVALLENAFARYQIEGKVPVPIGLRHPSITPFGLFKASDAHIVIAAGNDAALHRLCDALATSDLKRDSRFVTNADRCANRRLLTKLIDRQLAASSAAEWLNRPRVCEVACGPLNDVAALMEDPQLAARSMLPHFRMEDGTAIRIPGNPITFADEMPGICRPAPELDQHRSAILAECQIYSTTRQFVIVVADDQKPRKQLEHEGDERCSDWMQYHRMARKEMKLTGPIERSVGA